jgi:predicted metal-dependent hydrolase
MSQIIIKELNIACQLKRKNIKSLRLLIYPSGEITINAPYYLPKFIINKFINQKTDWIKKKLEGLNNNQLKEISNYTKLDYLKDKEKARELITKRLEFFNQYYNFQYKEIRIKNQKSLWGSCSKKANLNFNFRILYLPEKTRDYIIVHELCHLKELNHSKRFWQLVSLTIADYKNVRKNLKKGII